MTVFLCLLIAHLLGDFVLQRPAVIEGKHGSRWQAWVEHGAVHLGLLIGIWLVFNPAPLTAPAVVAGFGVIVVSHLVIDAAKIRFGRHRPLAAFVLDQLAHLFILGLVAAWLSGPGGFEPAAAAWESHRQALAVLAAAYLLTMFACGWLNRHLLDALFPPGVDGGEHDNGLARAGLIIGWLERFLLLSAFLIQAWAALGLVLAAKSVYRFGDIRKGRQEAEYFLIGTLISVTEVVLIGMLVRLTMALIGASP